MYKNPFTIHVPASTANLGPGFDCLGLALGLWNTATFSFEKQDTLFTVSGEGKEILPINKTNLIYQAMMKLAKAYQKRIPEDLHVDCQHEIPIMSGLGSSAGAIVCGLMAARQILEIDIDDEELLQHAIELEGHGDNSGACLLGGLVLVGKVNDTYTFRRLSIDPVRGLVAVPDYSLSTMDARKALPEKIAYSQAIYNMSHVIDLIEVFYTGEYERLYCAMQDQLHQPYRFPLLPGAEQAIRAAYEAGAYGACLSGAGPSMIALVDSDHEAVVSNAIQTTYKEAGVKTRLFPLDISSTGAYID